MSEMEWETVFFPLHSGGHGICGLEMFEPPQKQVGQGIRQRHWHQIQQGYTGPCKGSHFKGLKQETQQQTQS